MGKASKWFKKALLGFKKYNDSSSSSKKKLPEPKWSDVKSYKDKDLHYYHNDARVDPTIHAVHSSVVTISSVRTTAARAWNGEEWAAVVIQSHFRAYLSRRALRALKGLVKLQALVRGHIVRKQTAEMLRRMQALIRVQSRACAGRSHDFESPPLSAKSTQFLHHICNGPATPDKFEQIIRARSMKNDQIMSMLKRNSSNHMCCRMDKKQEFIARNASIGDEIIDTYYVNPKQRNLFHSSELSLNSDQFNYIYDHETCYTSVDNSPQLQSTASSRCYHSRTGQFTSNNHPNYMSYTEAAKAKTRSLSAPKLRPQYDMRFSRSNMQKSSKFYANFTSKGSTYQGSGRLDKIGMHVRGDSDEFGRGFWHVY